MYTISNTLYTCLFNIYTDVCMRIPIVSEMGIKYPLQVPCYSYWTHSE